MLCSVVIPLFNKAAYIGAALESILAQRHQDFEIIVVDDGSSDGGGAIVRAMPDQRIRLIEQSNGGVSRARNRGIDAARGELVCFLDGDDWYGPAFLETVVAMASAHPSGAFFATSFRRVRDYRRAEWEGQAASFDSAPVLDFFERRRRSGPFVSTNSVAVRRTDLLDLQPCFPPGEALGEDQDLWFRLAERLTLVFCPAQLVAYRIDVAGSLCAAPAPDNLLPVFSRLEQRARKYQRSDPARHSALVLVADARVSVARQALAANRRGEAARQLLKAYSGVFSKHWWVALAMCALFTPAMVQRWERWRETRIPDR